MGEEVYEIIKKYYIGLFILIGVGVLAGGLYYVNRYGSSYDVKDYLDSFLNRTREGMNNKSIFISSMRSWGITLAVLICGSFFRFGGVFICAELARRAFISGFTTTAFIRVYGLKGLFLALSQLPQTVLTIPCALLLGAFGTALSMKRIEKEKNIIIFYIIFSVICCAIFCAAAFCEGYLTTTFMKMLSKGAA